MPDPTSTLPGRSKRSADSIDSPLWFLPSWLASLLVHAALMAVFATSLKSCTGGIPGAREGEYRDVGLQLVGESDEEASSTPTESSRAGEGSPAESTASDGLSEAPSLDESPPVPLERPSESAATIGPGSAPPVSLPGDARNPIRANTIAGPSAAAARGIGLGTAEFFGIQDKATRVLYVLDCSGSMLNYGAIRVAKAELLASLQGLDKNQQFQAIFYNQSARELNLDGDRRSQLYYATEVNRTLARQQIDGMQADLGTDHMPALKKGLRLTPEVMYFLTDADEPQLTARDLNEIEKLNNGRTRIHCVEFGKGPELKGDNFLKKLARQNGGTYRYRDVTRFEKR